MQVMNHIILNKVEQPYLKASMPEVSVGDTVEVTNIIREGDKKRAQKFKGLIIAMKGSGISKTMTVRKISFGVGVEKIFPIHSPNVSDIKLIKTGKVRSSKIYYMRGREGKRALKVKAGAPMVVIEGEPEAAVETEVVEPTA
jgi:large subunit ribosomal protein L19